MVQAGRHCAGADCSALPPCYLSSISALLQAGALKFMTAAAWRNAGSGEV